MSHQEIYLTQGDTNDTRTLRAGGVDDLEWAESVEAHIWPLAGGVTTTLAATITDVAECLVSVDFGTWIDTALGRYKLELEFIDSGSSKPKTFPSEDAFPVRVRRQGD
jgi:hypothetical protein